MLQCIVVQDNHSGKEIALATNDGINKQPGRPGCHRCRSENQASLWAHVLWHRKTVVDAPGMTGHAILHGSMPDSARHVARPGIVAYRWQALDGAMLVADHVVWLVRQQAIFVTGQLACEEPVIDRVMRPR